MCQNVSGKYLRHEDGEDSGEAGSFELLDVGHVDAVLLELVDLVEGLLLLFNLHGGLSVSILDLHLLAFLFGLHVLNSNNLIY